MPFKCPAAPYEAAFLAESFVRRKGIRRKVEVHLFTPEHTPMPVAPAEVGDAIADLLAGRGINYHPLFTFKALRPESREVVASDGRTQKVDLLITVPPHQAPDVVRSSRFSAGVIERDPLAAINSLTPAVDRFAPDAEHRPGGAGPARARTRASEGRTRG